MLPIGGVKSKVMAGHRAGFKRVILPKLNERDWPEVPEAVRSDLELVLVEDMREVLAAALEPERMPVDVHGAGGGKTPGSGAAPAA